jgi:hypothetical protein
MSEQAESLPSYQPQPHSLRRRVVGTLILTVVPLGLATVTGLTPDLEYVYSGGDRLFGLFVQLVLALLVSLLIVLIVSIVRLFQKRWLEALVLTIGCLAPVLLLASWPIDRHAWKFSRYRAEYRAIIQSDLSPSPKFRIFDWGNHGGGFGTAITLEAIVYDESGEILRHPGVRSSNWAGQQAALSANTRWIVMGQSSDLELRGRRTVKPLGEHFYYVAEEL